MSSQAPLDSLKRSRRDQEAFSVFYRHYFHQILGFLARRVQDPEVAADLTAETFAQAFLHRRRFRGSSIGEVDRWIYRIAERQLSHYWRDGKTEQRAMERLRIQALAPGTVVEVMAGPDRIEVLDRGPGLADGEQELVLQRFHRGSAGRRGPTGSGLGLPIATELAREWGADVTLVNREGGGARAVLSWPEQEPR